MLVTYRMTVKLQAHYQSVLEIPHSFWSSLDWSSNFYVYSNF